jgi:hypothetical protein
MLNRIEPPLSNMKSYHHELRTSTICRDAYVRFYIYLLSTHLSLVCTSLSTNSELIFKFITIIAAKLPLYNS